ncbi:HNH endonuclease [Pseudomonadota bacterium]
MKMLQLDHTRLASQLTELYGLPLNSRPSEDQDGNYYIEFSPDGVPRNDGFIVRLTIGWRNLTGLFIPGPYSSPMIEAMGLAPETNKAAFAGIVSRFSEAGGKIEMKVNDRPVDPIAIAQWPGNWRKLSLSMMKSPVAVNTGDNKETEKLILSFSGKLFTAILSLMPLEENGVAEPMSPEYLPEGAKTRVEVNKYERNLINRGVCIEIHGCTCAVCGFNFESVYGDIGQGFVHVHHTTPVSQLGENYALNPLTDLVPVCPNCHAMLHKKNPPYTVSELRELMASTPDAEMA